MTGNGSGIGRAIQDVFHLNGENPIGVVGTHSYEYSKGKEVITRKYDITREEDRVLLVHSTPTPVMGLINCAGIAHGTPSEIFNTNLFAAQSLTEMVYHKFHNSLKWVCHIGSMVGVTGNYTPNWAYAASKAALHNLTLTQSKTMKPVRVFAVAPGLVSDTKIWKDESKHPAHGHALVGHMARPLDIARFVREACLNPYINGTILEISGGRL